MTTDRKPTRREAIDQAVRASWTEGDRQHRVKCAKAYLMDAVQAQAVSATCLSTRVTKGIALLTEALADSQPCAACKGGGREPRSA